MRSEQAARLGALGEALREARRRPLRSALTASGIAIGVTALVLLGALAEKFTRLVEGGRDFASGQITVSGAGAGTATGMTRGGLLSSDQLTGLAEVPGVRLVTPLIMFPATETPSPLPFTLAPLVFGVDLEALLLNRHALPPRVQAGRLLPGPLDEVVLGSQVAHHLGVGPGETMPIRGRTFRVVGVLEPTLTGPDSFIFMPFPMAQRLLVDSEPVLRRLVMVPGARLLPIATAAAVFWNENEDPEAVAQRIRTRLAHVSVVSPADAAAQLDRALALMSGLIVGSGLVALLVASLAVTNTMLTAVAERRREIGLRRIVGATRRQVIRAILVEAAGLGLAGSGLGLLTGAATVHLLNALTERLGARVFLLTPRLALAAALLPAALAVLAGLWPAWRAARLAPTEAVRYA